jgi:transcription initiation factor TFIIH subunit 3
MSLIVVIFDCSTAWVSGSPTILLEALTAVRVFVSALICSNRCNRIAAVASQGRHSRLVYVEPDVDDERKDGNSVADLVEKSFKDAIVNPDFLSQTSGIAGALSIALCYSHKLRAGRPQLGTSRFVVVSRSPDEPQGYVGMMNALFACQKDSVMLDVLCVCSTSSYLNQGTSLTQGLFVSASESFLPVLLGYFVADKATRKVVSLPKQPMVDSRGACFCHSRSVEKGYVCSVCMAIFCSFVPVCLMCQSKFDFGPLPSLQTRKQ